MPRDLFHLSRTVSAWLGGAVAVVGALALAGWIVGDPDLRAVYAGDINIKANAAIVLLALGVAVVLAGQPSSTSARLAVRLLAVLAIVVGGATLSQHLFGWNLGIDELLFREAPGALATASPNRMGPPASVCFPLIGIALLLLDWRTRHGRSPSEFLAGAAMIIALVPVIGYVLKLEPLYGTPRYTGIALNTAVSILALGFGILLARPGARGMGRLLANDSAGLLLRRLIPTAVAMPIVLGRLRVYGEERGWFDEDLGRSLLILSFILLFSGVTWWTSIVVGRHAMARARAEAAEREMHAGLLLSLESERHARDSAERSNRLKDEFLATLGHELRTPLNAILGWTHLLIGGRLSAKDADRGLQAVERNARVQAKLIEDLLDMSRIEAGKVRLDLQHVDLALVIESAIAAAVPAANAAGVTLAREIAGAAPVTQGDPARLQQVMGNLINNAVKFTPRGGRVTVSLSASPGRAEIAVRDTGVGIAAPFLPHVFDRFGQADGSTVRRHGGLGLGLTIARQLIELHGGTLTAASPGEGLGATFTVSLPTASSITASGRFVRPDAAALNLDASARLVGTRLLLVDDHEDGIEALARALRDAGIDVDSATSVDDALAMVQHATFDLVVTDIGMPERDGYDLLRELRALNLTMPVIALTAFARVEDEQRVLAAGFARHLAKPVAPQALMLAIAEVHQLGRNQTT